MRWLAAALSVFLVLAVGDAGALTPRQQEILDAVRAHIAAEGVQGLRPLAEQGDAKAQFALGNLYYFGQGTLQDYVEAVKWFRKAAEQGYACPPSAAVRQI
jgi:TPR repeat protein